MSQKSSTSSKNPANDDAALDEPAGDIQMDQLVQPVQQPKEEPQRQFFQV